MLRQNRTGLFIDNIRFYLLLLAMLLSLGLAGLLRLELGPGQAYAIRLQQVYGFIALGYWYAALLATPLSKLFASNARLQPYLFARRAIGVSAAYFALLHMFVSLYGQLGGWRSLPLLPVNFLWAIILGFVGMFVLLLLAATSFDRAIRLLTFPVWKNLHRLSYGAGVLVLLHVWMIGTHLEYAWLRWVIFAALAILSALEAWRLAAAIEKKSGEQNPVLRRLLVAALGCLFIGSIYALPAIVGRFHEKHEAVQQEFAP